jgi:WD40 repeat protein
VLEKHTQPIYTLEFSPDGNFFVSAGIDSLMNMWRTQDGAFVAAFDAESGIFEAHWRPTGDCIALTLANCTVAVINTKKIPFFQE